MEEKLIQKWLWMQTMEYALRTLKWQYQERIYPQKKYNEWKFIDWKEVQANIFKYALEHWETLDPQGQGSGDSRFMVGYDLFLDSSRIVGTYKDFKVEILWPEVKQFIKKMLSPEIEERQINLFDLLIGEAHHEKD